jgi:riboflavin biosynthesis pyrimidine reductase
MDVLVGPQPGPIEAADLVGAYPWPDTGGWVRAMMVATLDGATAGADGLSRSISSASDRTVFDAVRRMADVVLIGAGTFRAERYRPLLAKAADAEARAAAGLAAAPVVAIVSGSLDLPWEEPIFAESTVRPIVVTTASCDPARRQEAEGHADLMVLPGNRIEAGALLSGLSERGLHRVVCEGGARLLATIAVQGGLDEVDLSISPVMVGGGQIATGAASPVPHGYSLTQLIRASDDFLFTRYVRERPA